MARNRGSRTTRGGGFSLIEIIVVLVLLAILGVAGTESLHNIVSSYQLARSSDAVVQKTQMALNRMTIELSYVNPANLTGVNVTSGTATGITYTANLPNGDETHTISQSGTQLLYGTYILTDNVATNGIRFSFYNNFSDASPSAPSGSTTLVGITLIMHGETWPTGTNQTFSTRVLLNKPNQ